MAGDTSLQQKIQALTQYNGRLSVLLEEKRRDSKVLEERVAKLQEREDEYVETMLSVNRIWDQLSQDIVAACSSSCCQASDEDSSQADASAPAISISISDPFLRQLVRGVDPGPLKGVVDGCKKLDAGRSDVESALLQRAEVIKKSLAHVLGKVHGIGERHDAAIAKLMAMAPDAALRQECERLTGEVSTWKRKFDVSKALQRTTHEQLQTLEGKKMQMDELLRKTQNELGDTEQELNNILRKYHALKSEAGNSNASTGPTASQPSNCVPKPDPDAVKVEGGASMEELHDLQDLLAKRNADLDAMREQHLKTQRELQAALARCQDESKTHRQLLQEYQRLNEMFAAKSKELESVARERDEAQRDAMVKTQYCHAERISRQKLAAADAMYRELQAAKAESDDQRRELELSLQREREKFGHSKTVDELHTLIGTLKTQISQQQQHEKLNKVSIERLDESAQEVAACRGKLEGKDLEIQRLNDKLRLKDADMLEMKRQEQALKDRIGDLKAFVDVLTVYCNDVRDISEVRASEAVLRDQVTSLKSQLEGHELHHKIRELEVAERAAKDQTDLAAIEADSLRLEISKKGNEIEELKQQLSAARSECDLYISEIETTGAAYEDMQSQNSRLLQQLIEKDEAINQYMADRIKLTQAQQQLAEQLEVARSDAERLVENQKDLAALKEASDNEMANIASEIGMAKDQVRSLSSRVEAQSQEMMQRDDAIVKLQHQIESLNKQLADQRTRLEEADEKTLKDASKRQRLEDDHKVLSNKVDRLRKSSHVGGAAKELQEEVDAMRSLLNCNVCHERQKNVIITKCCHVFCDKCIKRNLESRNRKCPGCGVPFGQQDVKNFFFT